MNNYRMYPSDYYPDTSSDDQYHICNNNWDYPSPHFKGVPYNTLFDDTECSLRSDSSQLEMDNNKLVLKDYGPNPLVINIDKATKQNNNFRTGLWTGEHLQVTLMSIDVGDDIGLEIHPDVDQFIRIEEGQGLVKMGRSKEKLDFQANAYDDFAIMIPAGMWHNVINTGNKPLKVYAIYAPPEHPRDIVNVTKPIE
ncbi:cupin domain-containing protein [Clostridium taeniosporum]|uniref:Cupin domain-containing protein n=1 Tax=Clostridium taeniosporum TaxID=394958 RepID=A0A1D7XP57_9CLOT|nr:cupin domain-containing protein [Clostridium taeniosporum]AOR25122.1 cupin domain-containing protein [Clostridium taeniosporum]